MGGGWEEDEQAKDGEEGQPNVPPLPLGSAIGRRFEVWPEPHRLCCSYCRTPVAAAGFASQSWPLLAIGSPTAARQTGDVNEWEARKATTAIGAVTRLRQGNGLETDEDWKQEGTLDVVWGARCRLVWPKLGDAGFRGRVL